MTDDDRTLLLDLATEIRALREDVEKVRVLANSVQEQVGPTIDAITRHPALRLMLGGLR